MPLVTLPITGLLLAAAITGVVFALVTPDQRRRRRGVLVGSIVVGVLAITSIVLTLPTVIENVHVKVIVVSSGTTA